MIKSLERILEFIQNHLFLTNEDVVIGTFNFDPRSANYNAEMTIACNNNPETCPIGGR